MENCQNQHFLCLGPRGGPQVGLVSSAGQLDRPGRHDYDWQSRLEYPGELCVYPDSRWIPAVHEEPGDHEMPLGEPMIRGGARSDE